MCYNSKLISTFVCSKTNNYQKWGQHFNFCNRFMKIHEGKCTEKILKERERIGNRLAILRKKRNMTQEELANLCGVNRVNIAKIEKGAYNVSIDILSKVTSALGFVIDIKVDSSVCPTHFSQRKPVKLVIGEDYYVSFGNNEAHRCKLVDIPEMYQGQRIKIETPTPRGSITHILFADEIGTTPDEAVMNQVTM